MARSTFQPARLFDADDLVESSDRVNRDRRSDLGQFFTPKSIADFMASLFDACPSKIRLLDAGAGNGSLTEAFVQWLCQLKIKPDSLSVTAFEIDEHAVPALHEAMTRCRTECESVGIRFTSEVRHEDFISTASYSERGLFTERLRFDAAIVNPPYRKIQSTSSARKMLSAVGIETSNLYSGFISLIVRLLVPGGQLVAITPRSFCNGPYFKPFRIDFLSRMSLRRMHVFESRASAFADDNVLQENVIYHAVKARKPPTYVVISSSSGVPGAIVSARGTPFSDVVHPDDIEQFIHLETDDSHRIARNQMSTLTASLTDLGLKVSTGRVVDFRAREYLRADPEPGTVPLIYPCHFHQGGIAWPKIGGRKPNAIHSSAQSLGLLVPRGCYVLVKRFSAKEERRRIVASVCDPEILAGEAFGIENHLNYFHANGHGLERDLAFGLASFLNSTVVDQYFRQFSGHTQVNSTDLRSLRFPSTDQLRRFGQQHPPGLSTQAELDRLVDEEFF